MYNYEFLKEWFYQVWMKPSPEELEDRKKTSDKSGLPKEVHLTTSNHAYLL